MEPEPSVPSFNAGHDMSRVDWVRRQKDLLVHFGYSSAILNAVSSGYKHARNMRPLLLY